jgi:hypothetical protein
MSFSLPAETGLFDGLYLRIDKIDSLNLARPRTMR